MTFESSFRDLDLHNVCKMARNNEQQPHHVSPERASITYVKKKLKQHTGKQFENYRLHFTARIFFHLT